MLVKEATAREYTSVNSCSKDKYLLPNKGHLKRSSVQYQPFLSESECAKCAKKKFRELTCKKLTSVCCNVVFTAGHTNEGETLAGQLCRVRSRHCSDKQRVLTPGHQG